jgi:hypothetical protein
MGGLFSAPKPVIVEAPKPEPAPPAAAPAAATAAAEQAGQEARQESRSRAARGLAGTIATSPRGVLEALPMTGRKSLLGE